MIGNRKRMFSVRTHPTEAPRQNKKHMISDPTEPTQALLSVLSVPQLAISGSKSRYASNAETPLLTARNSFIRSRAVLAGGFTSVAIGTGTLCIAGDGPPDKQALEIACNENRSIRKHG